MKKFKIDFKNENRKNDASITSLLKYLNDEFDQEAVASQMVQKYFNVTGSKYFGKTKEMILADWRKKGEEACKMGSALDNFIDLYIKDDVSIAEYTSQNAVYAKRFDQWKTFFDTLEQRGYMLVGNEVPLSTIIDGQLVGGRCDMLLCRQTGDDEVDLLVIDWKTSSDITTALSKWDKPMKGGFAGLYQTKLHNYGIQVDFYKYCIKDMLIENGSLDGLSVNRIDTCVVQVKDDGVLEFANPLCDTGADVEKVIRYCLGQQRIASQPIMQYSPVNPDKPVATAQVDIPSAFEDELVSALIRHNIGSVIGLSNIELNIKIVNYIKSLKK